MIYIFEIPLAVEKVTSFFMRLKEEGGYESSPVFDDAKIYFTFTKVG